jgi:hypothetical protein
LDQAFTLNNGELKDYMLRALGSGQLVYSSDLPVKSAADLLAMSHAIEVATASQSAAGFEFYVQDEQRRGSNFYFEFDEFSFKMVKRD